MNLSTWIDLAGVFIELPLMIPLVPEGWKLPSVLSICISAANIMPATVMFLRWYQGKQFSEIPYVYIIIIVGLISCCVLAMFW
jgi:riboflavin transporter 2